MIVFAEIMDFVLVVVVLAVGLTQLVIPLWNATPIFPVFRRGRSQLSELGLAKEAVEEAWMEREIERVNKDAERMRRPRQPESPKDGGGESHGSG